MPNDEREIQFDADTMTLAHEIDWFANQHIRELTDVEYRVLQNAAAVLRDSAVLLVMVR